MSQSTVRANRSRSLLGGIVDSGAGRREHQRLPGTVGLHRPLGGAGHAPRSCVAASVEGAKRLHGLGQRRGLAGEAHEIEQSVGDFVTDDVLPAARFGRRAIHRQPEHVAEEGVDDRVATAQVGGDAPADRREHGKVGGIEAHQAPLLELGERE